MQGVTLRLVISTTTLLPARTKNRGRLSAVVPALRDFVQQLWSLQSHIASVSLATGSKIRASARTNTLFYVPTRLRPHCERDRACRSLRRTTVSTVAGRNIAKFDRELHLMYVPPLNIVSLSSLTRHQSSPSSPAYTYFDVSTQALLSNLATSLPSFVGPQASWTQRRSRHFRCSCVALQVCQVTALTKARGTLGSHHTPSGRSAR